MPPDREKQKTTEAQVHGDMPSTTSSAKSLEESSAPTLSVPKAFEDLPGEIRNLIYRALCQDIRRSSRPWKAKMTEYDLYIEEYTELRPFAMPHVTRQTQIEFFNVLYPSNHPVNSDSPFGMVFVTSELHIDAQTPDSHMKTFYLDVIARYLHDQEADHIEILFTIHLPEGVDLTKKSHDLIYDTLKQTFVTHDEFTVMQFLAAVHQVRSLPIVLDAEKWQEPCLTDLEFSELEDALNNQDEWQTTYAFRLVMGRADDGLMEVSMDVEKIDPYEDEIDRMLDSLQEWSG